MLHITHKQGRSESQATVTDYECHGALSNVGLICFHSSSLSFEMASMWLCYWKCLISPPATLPSTDPTQADSHGQRSWSSCRRSTVKWIPRRQRSGGIYSTSPPYQCAATPSGLLTAQHNIKWHVHIQCIYIHLAKQLICMCLLSSCFRNSDCFLDVFLFSSPVHSPSLPSMQAGSV